MNPRPVNLLKLFDGHLWMYLAAARIFTLELHLVAGRNAKTRLQIPVPDRVRRVCA